jgi:hypothetical protein
VSPRARTAVTPASAPTGGVAAGLELVPFRPLLASPIDAWFHVAPGDRTLVEPGQAVVRGEPLAERLRDARTLTLEGPGPDGDAVPGSLWTPPVGRTRDGAVLRPSELLFRSGGRWRVGTGTAVEILEAPVAGIVREVRQGLGILLRTPSVGLLGAEVLAGPVTGRLEIVAPRGGEIRASEINVGAAGSVLVAGARIDAEALTRARAVGVRGVVVATLGMNERRDFLASERRGRAGAHGLPPFAILVLDGAVRRPIAASAMRVLEALAGTTVAILPEPACLVTDAPDLELPLPVPGEVRVAAGPLAGAEGSWAGPAGAIRLPDAALAEAGLVRFGERPPVAVPLGDLERHA